MVLAVEHETAKRLFFSKTMGDDKFVLVVCADCPASRKFAA
jgi:hypothetical protein